MVIFFGVAVLDNFLFFVLESDVGFQRADLNVFFLGDLQTSNDGLEGHAAGETMGNVVKDSWSSHNWLVVDLPPSING